MKHTAARIQVGPFLVFLVAGFLVSSPAGAAPILVAPSGGAVVDFSQFGPGFSMPAGPVQVGALVGEDIVYTDNNSRSVIGNASYGFASNGGWNTDRDGFTGVNTDDLSVVSPNAITFRFNDGPVMSVGGFMNYVTPIREPVLILALGADLSVLEQYDIATLAPILTPGGVNEGAFRGISRPTADIYAFRYSGNVAALDDLTFARPASVPEPTSVVLLGFSALGLMIGRSRRRQPKSL